MNDMITKFREKFNNLRLEFKSLMESNFLYEDNEYLRKIRKKYNISKDEHIIKIYNIIKKELKKKFNIKTIQNNDVLDIKNTSSEEVNWETYFINNFIKDLNKNDDLIKKFLKVYADFLKHLNKLHNALIIKKYEKIFILKILSNALFNKNEIIKKNRTLEWINLDICSYEYTYDFIELLIQYDAYQSHKYLNNNNSVNDIKIFEKMTFTYLYSLIEKFFIMLLSKMSMKKFSNMTDDDLVKYNGVVCWILEQINFSNKKNFYYLNTDDINMGKIKIKEYSIDKIEIYNKFKISFMYFNINYWRNKFTHYYDGLNKPLSVLLENNTIFLFVFLLIYLFDLEDIIWKKHINDVEKIFNLKSDDAIEMIKKYHSEN